MATKLSILPLVDIFVCPDNLHEFFAMSVTEGRLALLCDYNTEVDYS